MNQELKNYLASIGKQGGCAKTEKKASAVRKNGTLGGRPRKDGLPPGSKALEDVLFAIDSSGLSEAAKRDLKTWASSSATLFSQGIPFLHRAEISKVEGMIGGKVKTFLSGT